MSILVNNVLYIHCDKGENFHATTRLRLFFKISCLPYHNETINDISLEPTNILSFYHQILWSDHSLVLSLQDDSNE